MLSKILLLPFILAQDGDDAPAAAAPLFGAYTEDTAESYDHDQMSMVWISFKTVDYATLYYSDDTKKDMTEESDTSISKKFKEKMEDLAKKIEKEVNKKYHIVFFDSKEYKDHAIEGLNCKVDESACVSVLLPMAGDKEDDEEVVYTTPFTAEFDPNKVYSEAEPAWYTEILKFVQLVEGPDGPEKEKHKFTPSFDDDDADGEDEPPEEDGFGSDDDKEV